jgi:hypothetical protein
VRLGCRSVVVRVENLQQVTFWRLACLLAAGLILKDSVRLAEQEVLRYLLAHQEARDTLEGIEKWWLPQIPQYGIADIAAALSDLQQRDLVRVWQSPFAQPIYGRAADLAVLEEYLRTLA